MPRRTVAELATMVVTKLVMLVSQYNFEIRHAVLSIKESIVFKYSNIQLYRQES